MSKRFAFLGLAAMLLMLNSGCCLINCINCWHDHFIEKYQATHFHDCGCGERMVNHWWNDPPNCCDPCDQWGNFTGRKWWVPNCMGCRGGGGGCGCGPGSCPGVSPAGRMDGPGDPGMYDDGAPMTGETVAPMEEVPPPTRSGRRNGRNYQPAPMQQQNGPSRMSRQPPRYTRSPDPRVTRRRPPRAEADVVPAQYQNGGPFYDDSEVYPADGYRVSTSGGNYRR
ncbi:MAG TPA: hypothetical protein VHY91_25535 [Pirellulales bacterium]|nr:hypothetical protein [Pirellulales bacterium]